LAGRQARSAVLRILSALYWAIGALAIFLGLSEMAILLSKGELLTAFAGNTAARIEIPVPYTNFLVPILPPSAIMLGVFLVLCERKYGWRAMPLTLMCAGAFDIIWNRDLFAAIWSANFWAFFQLVLLVGGWLLAGRPGFKFTWAFPLAIALFAITNATYNQPFELGLLVFVYVSAVFGPEAK
jgi:hypothetical protein